MWYPLETLLQLCRRGEGVDADCRMHGDELVGNEQGSTGPDNLVQDRECARFENAKAPGEPSHRVVETA